jgi:hypothetical protein
MVEWDVGWADKHARETMSYLAAHYPECAAAPELHQYQEDAYQAAVAGDQEAFLEALRAYMRCGRAVAMRIRKGAA